jgi:hypothetical protein
MTTSESVNNNLGNNHEWRVKKMNKVSIKFLTVVTSVLMLVVSGSNAYAVSLLPGYELPGITPSGYPNFENSVKLKVKKKGQKGFKLRVRKKGKDNYLNANSERLKIKGGNYKLKAMFDPFGNFLEGTLKIKGKVDTPLGKAKGTLMTATLTSFAFDSDFDNGLGGSLLGFNTTDIECNSIIDAWVNCTSNESVYILLDEYGFAPTVKNYKSKGLSVATIPVPAAVWLFGSGLIALVGMTRRRKL